ncbi:hypothetical protein BXZ70DRAFT_908223 [Cristinia sonorae]|uniref:Uncharacterized protein n=1 Tax=Cristinia sonorae TaxID=1940300 RepID=A0A8K0XNN4_9AGAR|nr:hypothetical protein BXZ70DRAFT_908223 [Cristinia sonorae]
MPSTAPTTELQTEELALATIALRIQAALKYQPAKEAPEFKEWNQGMREEYNMLKQVATSKDTRAPTLCAALAHMFNTSTTFQQDIFDHALGKFNNEVGLEGSTLYSSLPRGINEDLGANQWWLRVLKSKQPQPSNSLAVAAVVHAREQLARYKLTPKTGFTAAELDQINVDVSQVGPLTRAEQGYILQVLRLYPAAVLTYAQAQRYLIQWHKDNFKAAATGVPQLARHASLPGRILSKQPSSNPPQAHHTRTVSGVKRRMDDVADRTGSSESGDGMPGERAGKRARLDEGDEGQDDTEPVAAHTGPIPTSKYIAAKVPSRHVRLSTAFHAKMACDDARRSLVERLVQGKDIFLPAEDSQWSVPGTRRYPCGVTFVQGVNEPAHTFRFRRLQYIFNNAIENALADFYGGWRARAAVTTGEELFEAQFALRRLISGRTNASVQAELPSPAARALPQSSTPSQTVFPGGRSEASGGAASILQAVPPFADFCFPGVCQHGEQGVMGVTSPPPPGQGVYSTIILVYTFYSTTCVIIENINSTTHQY